MRLLKVGLIFAIPTIAKLLAGLAIIKIIAIYLGADGLGRLGQFMSLMSMLVVLAGGGIYNGIVKYVAEFKEQKDKLSEYIQTASSITFITSLLLFFIILFFSNNISHALFKTSIYSDQIRVLAFVQVAIGFGSFLLGLLNGYRDIKAFAFVNVISVFLGAVGAVIGIAWYGITGAMYGIMWFSSCQIICLIFWYHFSFNENWSFLRPKWQPLAAKKFSNFSLMQIITVVTMQMSQILIRNMLEVNSGWASVGFWQGLVKISDAYLLFITIVLANYYMPRLSELKNKNKILLEVFSVYKVVIPSLLLFIPVLFLFRNFIVTVLFSAEFLIISDLFFWQVVGDFFKVIAYVSVYVAIAKAATKICIAAEVFQAALLITLSYFLINLYGLQGAIYAYALTYFVYAVVCFCCFKLYAKFNSVGDVLKLGLIK